MENLEKILNNYKGEFKDLFTEIGSYNFGRELSFAIVFYSKAYKLFKVRKYFITYNQDDKGRFPNNSKDEFFNINGKKLGHSLIGARVNLLVEKFIKKHNIKPDVEKYLSKKSAIDRLYLKKEKLDSEIFYKDMFSEIKMLFVSMISDKSKKAKEKLKKWKTSKN